MDPNRRPLTSRNYRWIQALAAWLARKGVTANGISIAGMVFATIGAAAYLLFRWSFDPEGFLRVHAVLAGSVDPVKEGLRFEASSFSPTSFLIQSHVSCTIGASPSLQVAYDAWRRGLLIGWCSLIAVPVCIQLRLMCNLLDGLVAVEGGRKGKAGNLFNEAPDRFADVVLLSAAGCAVGAAWLGWMAAAFAVGTAYARAFGASLNLGQDFCGPFAKQQRMFLLTAGTLAALFRYDLLYWTLWIIAAGTLLTFVRRIVRIYRQLP